MVAKAISPALKRKTEATRRIADEREVSPAKALRLSFARAADEALDLALSVRDVAEHRRALAPLAEQASDEQCIILLEGPLGARGLVLLELPVVVGVVEVQTTGQVGRSEVAPRNITATDAALIQPLLDGMLARFEHLLERTRNSDWARGFRFGSRIPQARNIELMLEDLPYRMFEMALDLGLGARQGRMILALPLEARQPDEMRSDPVQSERRQQLGRTVMSLPAELNVVLAHPRVTWDVMQGFAPGTLIELGEARLDRAMLESDGRVLARVRVGRMEDMRAARVVPSEAGRPEFADLGGQEQLSLPSFGGVSFDSDDEAEAGLPDLGGFDTDGSLPDLPDLPELPDLPALD